MPIPRIYAYSLDSLNPVGAEYIIEEKARGKPLGNLWHQWQRESQLYLVTQLVDFETKLVSVSFSETRLHLLQEGFRKECLPAYDLEARSLSPDGSTGRFDSVLTEEFALGPLTEARLWEGERATMNLDRGPCKFTRLLT